MDTQTKPVSFAVAIVAVLAAALILRWIFSRGKTLIEGLIGLAAGFCGAVIAATIAHFIGEPPVIVREFLPNAEAFMLALVAGGAMAGDRIAIGIMKEAERFSADPKAWLERWMPRLGSRKSGGNNDGA